MTSHRLHVVSEDEVREEQFEVVDGVKVLRQDFEIPEGGFPVRMQVGEAPVTIIGWTDGTTEALCGLLTNVMEELQKIEKVRQEVDESGS
jgi:hypothetical protein